MSHRKWGEIFFFWVTSYSNVFSCEQWEIYDGIDRWTHTCCFDDGTRWCTQNPLKKGTTKNIKIKSWTKPFTFFSSCFLCLIPIHHLSEITVYFFTKELDVTNTFYWNGKFRFWSFWIKGKRDSNSTSSQIFTNNQACWVSGLLSGLPFRYLRIFTSPNPFQNKIISCSSWKSWRTDSQVVVLITAERESARGGRWEGVGVWTD